MAGEEAPIAIDVAGLGALEAAPALPKKPSMLAMVAELVILTCFAIGAGGLFGMQMLGGNDAGAPKHEAAAAKTQKGKYSEGSNLKALPVIVTNLAGAKGTWIRIEASFVLDADAPNANALAASISEDIVAYLRTVPVDQLEGPSGFLHLREDLNDRARIRSGGKIRELVIQGLVLE
jgi:flagellar FliL protein